MADRKIMQIMPAEGWGAAFEDGEDEVISPLVGWALWGMALFSLLWVGVQARAIAALPFGLPHWGLSFPLAALAALTLRLASPGGFMANLGVLLLALASLVIAGLVLATVRGLRDGTLLAPEPVAAIQPAPVP